MRFSRRFRTELDLVRFGYMLYLVPSKRGKVHSMKHLEQQPRGFTLTEVMVVISVIAILVAMVLYVTSGFSDSDSFVRSKNHLRQINQWAQGYTNAHNGRILPSQFDRLNEAGSEVGSVASRKAYSLTSVPGQGGDVVQWIENNNRYNMQGDPVLDLIGRGTWADILWVENNLNEKLGMPDIKIGSHMTDSSYYSQYPDSWAGGDRSYRSYKYAAPDRAYYEQFSSWEKNPLRSVADNSWNYPRWDDSGNQVDFDKTRVGLPDSMDLRPAGLAFPSGSGAWQQNMPGFFAANNFFDGRSEQDYSGDLNRSSTDREWAEGQIHAPARSMYLVDSFAGETVGGTPAFLGSPTYQTQLQNYYQDTMESFSVPGDLIYDIDKNIISDRPNDGVCFQEIDFRYNGGASCLMLFLDGHVSQEDAWSTIWDLEGSNLNTGRNIRIMDLDKRKATPLLQPGGSP